MDHLRFCVFSYVMHSRSNLTAQDFEQIFYFCRGVADIDSPEFAQAFPQAIEIWQAQPREELLGWYRQFAKDLEAGVQILFPGHSFYPSQYLNLDQAPLFLQFVGSPIWLTQKGLAIVGSREPRPISLAWMENELMQFLKPNQMYTVSGGARGVDQHVHRLSLRSQVPTVALLPSGLGNIYPSSFQSFIEPIVSTGGAVVTEYFASARMQKHHFLERNRLITGLALCCLVVEASKRSGSLLSARHCIEQNKPVLVIPSHPTDICFAGGLSLLSEGATLIRDALDIRIIFESESGMLL